MAIGFMDNLKSNPPWGVDECVANGGHCWEMSDAVICTMPPIHHRRCKHCFLVQEGQEQDSYSWHDDSHQPWVRREG
jgi:hypothetical protein